MCLPSYFEFSEKLFFLLQARISILLFHATKTYLFIKFEYMPVLELYVMRFKVFVSDILYGFLNKNERLSRLITYFTWSDLLNSDIEKRERLVQTYLIVFGLFLSYDRNSDLQYTLMKCFVGFLWFSLIYYSLITHKCLFTCRFSVNAFAVLMALMFSIAFVFCYAVFGSGNTSDIWEIFLITVFVVGFPLFVWLSLCLVWGVWSKCKHARVWPDVIPMTAICSRVTLKTNSFFSYEE